MTSTLLTPAEAVEKLRTGVRTIERWRHTGGGPRFLNIGRKVALPDRGSRSLAPTAGARAYRQRGVAHFTRRCHDTTRRSGRDWRLDACHSAARTSRHVQLARSRVPSAQCAALRADADVDPPAIIGAGGIDGERGLSAGRHWHERTARDGVAPEERTHDPGNRRRRRRARDRRRRRAAPQGRTFAAARSV